jgi:hypothetical protein
MSTYRLSATTATMTAVAVVLSLLTPPIGAMAAAVLDAQRTADSAGPEALVLAGAGLLAWGVWAWGALGLLLTAGAALPGVLGAVAGVLTGVVLPAGARRSAALALGLGLSVAGPLAGTTLVVLAPAAAAQTTQTTVPDWPGVDARPGAMPDRPGSTVAAGPGPSASVPLAAPSDGAALPDWPAAPAEGDHVVLRGDCLWDIAAARLAAQLGRHPTAAETAGAAAAWWAANAAVIGPDPDVLLPGQVLRPPLT